MKKKLLCAIFLLLSHSTQAVEIDGVELPDVVHLGNSNLVLNGAGVRSKFIFDVYVTALYLSAKKNMATAVLSDLGEKRIAMYFLDDISAANLLYSFDEGIRENHSAAELAAMKEDLHKFDVICHRMVRLKAGDVVLFDYQIGTGTQVRVNGGLRGTIAGSSFYNMLLKIWLGEKPMQQDLKLKLLGGF